MNDAGCDFDIFVAQDLIALKLRERKLYAVWLCTMKITIIREFTYFKYTALERVTHCAISIYYEPELVSFLNR